VLYLVHPRTHSRTHARTHARARARARSEIETKGDDTRKAPAALLDDFSENFGFARLTVNASALHFQWEQVKAWSSAHKRFVAAPDAFKDEFYVTR
jgi:hypothetical protein